MNVNKVISEPKIVKINNEIVWENEGGNLSKDINLFFDS